MKFPNPFKNVAFSLKYGEQIHPVRDWLAILAASTILFIASIAWNAWTYYQVTSGDVVIENVPSSSSVGLRSLEEARAVLTSRAEEEARYRSFYEFVDPSI